MNSRGQGGEAHGGGRTHKGSDSTPSLWWRRVIARNLPLLIEDFGNCREKRKRKGSLTKEIDPREDFGLGERERLSFGEMQRTQQRRFTCASGGHYEILEGVGTGGGRPRGVDGCTKGVTAPPHCGGVASSPVIFPPYRRLRKLSSGKSVKGKAFTEQIDPREEGKRFGYLLRKRRTQQRRFTCASGRQRYEIPGGKGGQERGDGRTKGVTASRSLWWRGVIARNLPSLSRTSEIVVGEKRKRKGSLIEKIDPREDFGWGEKGKVCLLGEKVGPNSEFEGRSSSQAFTCASDGSIMKFLGEGEANGGGCTKGVTASLHCGGVASSPVIFPSLSRTSEIVVGR
ncbi:hypothetical protein CEXT_651121 [Caerostris extrusa]|uniref:Uncharacterized protein n=1 Tax=Caerostris extrusa TaxID=172846 RepID=A0AAV4T886_CAEEX|nr:hypothetical protein CEXT_651121 [Caerostris extrusa]